MKDILVRRVAPVTIAMMLVALPVQLAHGQEENERITIEELLKIFQRSENILVNIFAILEARGVPVPEEVKANYDRGLAIAGEAVKLRDAGELSEAREKILDAMRHLRDTVLSVAHDFENVETEEERENRRAAGIAEAVERIQASIERLENIADKVSGMGLDASRIRERLTLVQTLLNEINERIEAGDISEAARKMEMSQREFGEAMAGLRPIMENVKSSQADRFLSMVEDRLSTISDTVLGVIENAPISQSVREMVMQRANEGIRIAQNKIAEVRELLLRGDVEGAMPRLNELRLNIENIAEGARQIPEVAEGLENLGQQEKIFPSLPITPPRRVP